ncbi:hypothetical protein GS597_02140 [Synechococcales cyanobacterium C]|uniref:Nucleotidyltransferase family protein n=1 Tax=Petrachloros mirabilis ULC683 TaxID=2781853 RepID=A0A8K1ZX80_9CYAN|nr:hypothetical protein [Petrachloros mirabilis]NCJ05332.1 hypothetical protein [Petrachloros mirabilis ULC683]
MATQVPSLKVPIGYCPQADDTNSETDLLCFYLLNQRTATERLSMAAAMTRNARQLSLHCLSRQFAYLSAKAFARKLAEAWLQEDCPPDYIPTGSEMTWIQDSTELAAQLHCIFATLEVPYYVTGGVAAIAYGEPRTTRDLDVVISVPPSTLMRLVSVLEAAGFYLPGVADVPTELMRTLQVTQLDTISRADLVLADDTEYERLKFQRRRLMSWPDGTEVYLIAPEDVVVSKLRWRLHSQSEKQWRDVLGVLKTQQEQLDYEYMHHWAVAFDLSRVLEQVTLEAGVRAIADQQWATATYPTINRAFQLAQERNRTTQPRSNLNIAEGNRYRLIKDSSAQTLAVVAKADDREIARYDLQGAVVDARPFLQDRQQWRAIAQQV